MPSSECGGLPTGGDPHARGYPVPLWEGSLASQEAVPLTGFPLARRVALDVVTHYIFSHCLMGSESSSRRTRQKDKKCQRPKASTSPKTQDRCFLLFDGAFLATDRKPIEMQFG